MGLILGTIFAYLLVGIPIAVMFNRAGKSWALSLLVLIPYLGMAIALLVLATSHWQPRGRRA